MSLAARCPACSTVFRVVQDQLRVSEGWVRCGRCSEVFNALETLFDLTRDGPPTAAAPWPADASTPPPADAAATSSPDRIEAPDAAWHDRKAPIGESGPAPAAVRTADAAADAARAVDADGGAAADADADADAGVVAGAGAGAGADAVADAARDVNAGASAKANADGNVDAVAGAGPDTDADTDAVVDTDADADADAARVPTATTSRAATVATAVTATAATATPAVAPSFFTGPLAEPPEESAFATTAAAHSGSPLDAPASEPSRDAGNDDDATGAGRETSTPDFALVPPAAGGYAPRTRRGLGTAAVVALLLLLGSQIAAHQREEIAARWPATEPLWRVLCSGSSGCVPGPPRRIDEVVVESTALTQAADGSGFDLAVGLRNRGTVALAVPAVDLSLTDPNGRLVARRVLQPSDFRRAPGRIEPGAEALLRAVVAAEGASVTGYTVEIFYP